jgi:4-hydroxy-3-polyprenylbenzoate decarboxylase
VTVLPAAPGFYGKPQSVSDMVDFIVARVLDHLQVPHDLGPRWGEDDGKVKSKNEKVTGY